MEITEEQATEIFDNEIGAEITIEGVTYTITDQVRNFFEYRWADTTLTVLTDGSGSLYGSFYDVGASEDQESGCIYTEPELFPVSANVIMTTEYTRV